MELYEQTLVIAEELGDIEGKTSSLSIMAGVCEKRGDYDQAEQMLKQSTSLSRQIGHSKRIAFNMMGLGRLAQARSDTQTAHACYCEALAIFERLGMPRESAQVRQLIASLEGGGQPASPADPLRQLTAQARAAAQADDVESAIAAQEQAVSLARQAVEETAENRDALVALSVLLYNLAGYYARADRHQDSVAALEEVVALDERTHHPDLESDRQALEQALRLASLSPEERAQLAAAQLDPAQLSAAVEAQLAQLPPEQRAEMEAAAREFARRLEQMSDEERAQYLAAAQAAARRQQIDDLAGQARDGAIAALRGQTDPAALIAKIENVTAQAAEGEQPGSPWYELAAYLRAVVALLRGEPLPPVPEPYAAHVAAIQNAT